MNEQGVASNFASTVASLLAAGVMGCGVVAVFLGWSGGLSAASDFLFGTHLLRNGLLSSAFLLPAIPFGMFGFFVAVNPAKRCLDNWLWRANHEPRNQRPV